MNILFLTLVSIRNLEEHNIYSDLMRKFVNNGHNVLIASAVERRHNEKTSLIKYEKYSVLRVKVGNMQKCNIIEKGISTIMIEYQFLSEIKKYFADIKFDLIMYSTPPITFLKVVEYVKRRDNAKTYLLLKDIFPQNAIDLGMFSKNNPIYKFFRAKEKKLYAQSDHIGCMSQANVDYVLRNNPELIPSKVHVSPNSIEITECDFSKRDSIRKKYVIPTDKKVFIYGGNLGKPQGIDFLIECLKENMNKSDRYFVICGTGTEYPKLKTFVDTFNPENILLINGLSKDEYEDFIASCDVGLIFLDYRFTIPNFPSRMLSYMQKSMPILACTDANTDIGKVITEGGFGWWCESNNAIFFTSTVDNICNLDITNESRRSREYLIENFTVDKSYKIIMERVNADCSK